MSSEANETPDPNAKLDEIPERDISEEMSQSYIDYAMSVIAGRALPDVRDGLKPVHRRILYAMDEAGVSSGSSHTKSARVVGDTMGNFHPHGDRAAYDALVRMAQDFSMWGPLVDGQGNFGSIDDDPAAAMRYTESRLSELGEELLDDVNPEVVDFQPNYDNRLEEPEVLPSRFPNLLVNGTSGIAVGMTTDILPHNLGEVIDATVHRIDNPNSTVADLMEHLPAPDFPTGATILGRDEIRKAYETGKGKPRVRANYELDRENDRIIITEIPYLGNKSKLVKNIADDIKNDKIEGVSDLRDESDNEGIRIVVDLKRGANIDLVENQLVREELEETMTMNHIALVDGQPKRLSLPELLDHYIDHRRGVVRRRSQKELDEAEDRAHILEGRLVAVDNADDIVELIRNSDDRDTAIDALTSHDEYDFSEEQAEHIVRMQLGSLTSMEAGEIEAEYEDLQDRIERLEEILGDASELDAVIKEELREVKADYDRERRTRISDDYSQVDDEDLIPEKDVVVMVTGENYVKRIDADTFDAQSRGGKGIIGTNLKDDDHVDTVLYANTHERLLCFTSEGNVYGIKGYDIPEASRQARGTFAANIDGMNLNDGEKLVALVPAGDLGDDDYITLATRGGYVKRTAGTEYNNIYTNGKRAISLEDDVLVDAHVTDGDMNVFLATAHGQSIRFEEDEIRAMGRTARGVNGIKLADGDEVVGFDIAENGHGTLFTVTENGFGKQTDIGEYRKQSRYGKGIRNVKHTDKNGDVVSIAVLEEDAHDLVVMSKDGQIVRIPASDVPTYGRNTEGVITMDLYDGDHVTTFDAIPVDN